MGDTATAAVKGGREKEGMLMLHQLKANMFFVIYINGEIYYLSYIFRES